MNPLALMWAERQVKRLERMEMIKLARELREEQTKMAPILKEHRRKRQEAMRQDGPKGFVMVERV